MLAIRLQRVGRKGFPVYRLAVQEAQRHPSSGRVVAYVGSYNPHTKDATVQVELAQKYLDNGAQPSPRVVKLLKDAGVKLPSWVKEPGSKSKTIRHADKLRRNRPSSAQTSEEVSADKEEVTKDVAPEAEAAPVEDVAEDTSVEKVADESAA